MGFVSSDIIGGFERQDGNSVGKYRVVRGCICSWVCLEESDFGLPTDTQFVGFSEILRVQILLRLKKLYSLTKFKKN